MPLNADFTWECPACHRLYGQPRWAAECLCRRPKPAATTILAPLVRSTALPMWEGHPVALTGWLEAEQAELTVLHRGRNGALRPTRHRFCAPRTSLQPTGQFAQLPPA